MNNAEARRVSIRLVKAEQKLVEALHLIEEAVDLTPMRLGNVDDADRKQALQNLATVVQQTSVLPTWREAMKWEGLVRDNSVVDMSSKTR